MNIEQIEKLKESIGIALENAVQDKERIIYLERVIRQAVLTAGGVLKVSAAKADEAKRDQRYIMIGGGEITLED